MRKPLQLLSYGRVKSKTLFGNLKLRSPRWNHADLIAPGGPSSPEAMIKSMDVFKKLLNQIAARAT